MYLPDDTIVMEELLIFVWSVLAVSLCEDVSCSGIECHTILSLFECVCSVVLWIFPTYDI
jgi:hypothetical protein